MGKIIRDEFSQSDLAALVNKGGSMKMMLLAGIIGHCIDQVNALDIPATLLENARSDAATEGKLAALSSIIAAAAALTSDTDKSARIVTDATAAIYVLGYQAGFAASLEES